MNNAALEEGISEISYVSRDLFDERQEKNQAVIDKNMAEVRAMFTEIRGDMKVINAEIRRVEMSLNTRLEQVDMKISNVDDTLSIAFMGLEKRLDDMKDYQNKWFTIFGVLMSVLSVAFAVFAFFK